MVEINLLTVTTGGGLEGIAGGFGWPSLISDFLVLALLVLALQVLDGVTGRAYKENIQSVHGVTTSTA